MSRTTILIVEDEAIVAEDLAGKLERMGYAVVGIAATCRDAIDSTVRLQPKLLLMDIQLGGAPDGIAAADAIRQRFDVPVIFLTAHSDPATLSRAKLTGPFGYILKPFEERDLGTQIELALHMHQADRRVREQREWLRVTLKSIGEAVIAADSNGRVTFVNPVAEALTGWPSAEAMDRPATFVFRIVDERTGQLLENPVSQVLREKRPANGGAHAALETRTGSRVAIEGEAAPILDTGNEAVGVVLVFRDVTDARRTREALREREQRYRSLFHDNHAVLLLIDPRDGRIADANPAACAYYGYPLDRMTTLAVSDIDTLTAAEVRSKLQSAQASRRRHFHDRHRLADGRVRDVEVFSGPLVVEGKSLLFAIVHDVTERKQAEKALRELNDTLEQQVAERTQLAETRAKQLQALAVELIQTEERERRRMADLLHDDVQQVLACARLQLQTARENRSDPTMLAAVEEMLEESIGKVRRLSHELSPSILQHLDIAAGLQWVAEQMRAQFGLDVRIESAGSRQIDGDLLKVFLMRAVRELLFNVVKHAGVDSAAVRLAESDGGLSVAVVDRGRGVDPGILDTCTPAAGMGLLSLRERARHIGGDLVVESGHGRGSRFTLTLPCRLNRSEPPAAPQAPLVCDAPGAKAAADDAPGETIRVLLADDHQVLRHAFAELIARQPNIEVVGEAADGREAVEQVGRLNPDVVIMDVSMPVMDGIEATRHIKAAYDRVRVIGLSMHEEAQLIQMMIEEGMETVVSKTASIQELLAAICGAGCERERPA
ncbi:MAG TPA: response regulator [Desulfosarcina sp.]|nr:response regulator [Desulfosarcina sp.]